MGQAGKIRGSYIDGMDRVHPLRPGHVYHAQILPWEFAHEIKKGHRIGLLLSPTLFPLYARNLGPAEPIATGTRMIVQHDVFMFGPDTPSRLTFQVLWER